MLLKSRLRISQASCIAYHAPRDILLINRPIFREEGVVTEDIEAIGTTNYKDFPIRVEWHSEAGRVTPTAREGDEQELQARAQKALNMAMGTLKVMAYRVSRAVNSLEEKVRPDEAEIEFGINLDSEIGAVVAKASAGAQFTITLKWVVAQPERAEVIVE